MSYMLSLASFVAVVSSAVNEGSLFLQRLVDVNNELWNIQRHL